MDIEKLRVEIEKGAELFLIPDSVEWSFMNNRVIEFAKLRQGLLVESDYAEFVELVKKLKRMCSSCDDMIEDFSDNALYEQIKSLSSFCRLVVDGVVTVIVKAA